MPLCSVKKNPDDKLNRHICIVFGLLSEFFSRDIITRRFVQQHTLEELLLAVVLFSGFLTLADFNLAVFHPEGISAVLSLALQIQPLMWQGCPRAVTKDSKRKPLKMKGEKCYYKIK